MRRPPRSRATRRAAAARRLSALPGLLHPRGLQLRGGEDELLLVGQAPGELAQPGPTRCALRCRGGTMSAE